MYKPTILLVDNDADTLGSSRRYLTSNGYNIQTASSAEEALRYCQQEVVHLVLIDVRLEDDKDEKDRSGLRLAAQLDPSISKIIVTGQYYTDPADLVSRVLTPDDQGKVLASDFVKKSKDPSELLKKIQIAFQQKVKLNTDIKITFANGLNWRTLVEQLKMFRNQDDEDKRKAEQVLEDLTRKLFHRTSSIRFMQATPGYSSCMWCKCVLSMTKNRGLTWLLSLVPRITLRRK